MSISVDQMGTQSCVKSVVIELIVPYMNIVVDIRDHMQAKLLLHVFTTLCHSYITNTQHKCSLICTLQFVYIMITHCATGQSYQ